MTQRKKPLEECRDKELVIAAGMMNKDDRDMKTKQHLKPPKNSKTQLGAFIKMAVPPTTRPFKRYSAICCALEISISQLNYSNLRSLSASPTTSRKSE